MADQKTDPDPLFNYAHSLVILAEEYFSVSNETRHTLEEFGILLQESIDRKMDMEHLFSGLSFLFDGHDQYVTKFRVFFQEYHKKILETNTEEQSRCSGSKSVEEAAPKRHRSKSTSVVCEEAETSTRKRPRSKSEEDTNISTPKRPRSKSPPVEYQEDEEETNISTRKRSKSIESEETKIPTPKRRRSPSTAVKPEEKEDPLKRKVRACLEFIDKVKDYLEDKVKYKYFLRIIMDFQEHEDIDRIKRDGYPLFAENPALELEFSRYIFSATESRINGKEENKMEFYQLPKFSDGFYVPVPGIYEQKLIDCENEMFEFDRYICSMTLSKKAAECLVKENSGQNPEEVINVGKYFSELNFIFLKRDLRGRKYVLDKDMSRRSAVEKSEEIASYLTKKLKELEKTRKAKNEIWKAVIKENTGRRSSTTVKWLLVI